MFIRQMIMGYNKLKLKVGDRVIIDEGFKNSCEVVIQEFSPNEMFCWVKHDNGESWKTMTYRLTKIK